jgi:hypothetical protein
MTIEQLEDNIKAFIYVVKASYDDNPWAKREDKTLEAWLEEFKEWLDTNS